ncbi:MAG: DUF2520 domain-containing protein [Crocinitomicaceae bacterium]|nr:DUF2520 domain-containing protein [Crocinitomicaceae bacterium]
MQNANNISIIGSGNVGHHLAKELSKVGVSVTHISGHNTKSDSGLANEIGAEVCEIEKLPKDQLVLICVRDEAINEVLEQLDNSIPAAYTSGSIQLNDLPERTDLGVFYPLQTFTKGRELNISQVPFFIEATNTDFSNRLMKLASEISENVNLASSTERKNMHVAAVMVNNFTNHILHEAKTYSDEHNIDFKHFLPLLNETVNKLKSDTPYDAQTGPARRGDQQTIEDHLNSLEGLSKEIYKLISDSIKRTYPKNDEL